MHPDIYNVQNQNTENINMYLHTRDIAQNYEYPGISIIFDQSMLIFLSIIVLRLWWNFWLQ